MTDPCADRNYLSKPLEELILLLYVVGDGEDEEFVSVVPDSAVSCPDKAAN